jgi:hypothetical protein
MKLHSKEKINLNLIFLALTLIFFAQSCQEDFNIILPKHTPLITVNGILNDNEPIHMSISSSHADSIPVDSSLTINNAKIKFFEDNVFIGDLIYQETYQSKPIYKVVDKFYTLNGFKPTLNHTYNISVTASGLKDVSSKTIIPIPVQIISVDTNTVYTKSGQYTIKALECTIKFKDPAGLRNCYKLDITRLGRYGGCDYSGRNCEPISLKQKSVSFLCYDLNAIYFKSSPNEPGSILPENDNEGLSVSLREIFLADDSFDGTTYELKILIPIPLEDFLIYPGKNGTTLLSKIFFRLYSINEEYYKYARSFFTQVFKRNDIFSEPVKVFSNITDGMGIFSGSSVNVDSSLVLPVYLRQSY